MDEYHRPTTPDQAVQLLAQLPGSQVIGGGTLVMGRLWPQRPDSIVDLCTAGLSRIERRGQRLRLGATLTPHMLWQALELQASGMRALREAAARFEPEPVRRQATLGGNLMTGVGSLVPALLVLEAKAIMLGPEGERLAPVAPLKLHVGEVITAVEVEFCSGAARSLSADLRRTPVGPAIASVAVHLEAGQLRVAVGGVEGVARRMRELEGPIDKCSPRQWGEAVGEALRPISDSRGGGDYRRAMARVLVRRLVSALVEG